METDFELILNNDNDEPIHLTGIVYGELNMADSSVGIMYDSWQISKIFLSDEDGKDIPMRFLNSRETEKVEEAAQKALD